jgi:hypothetical protein
MSRENRITRRAAPLAALAVLALIAGLVVGAMSESDEERVARDFARAWEQGDHGAIWRLLTPAVQEETTPQELSEAYREAFATATATHIDVDDVEPEDGGASMRATVTTRIFGDVEGRVELPIEDGAVDWQPHHAFPGLRPGETLTRSTTAPREDPRA